MTQTFDERLKHNECGRTISSTEHKEDAHSQETTISHHETENTSPCNIIPFPTVRITAYPNPRYTHVIPSSLIPFCYPPCNPRSGTQEVQLGIGSLNGEGSQRPQYSQNNPDDVTKIQPTTRSRVQRTLCDSFPTKRDSHDGSLGKVSEQKERPMHYSRPNFNETQIVQDDEATQIHQDELAKHHDTQLLQQEMDKWWDRELCNRDPPKQDQENDSLAPLQANKNMQDPRDEFRQAGPTFTQHLTGGACLPLNPNAEMDPNGSRRTTRWPNLGMETPVNDGSQITGPMRKKNANNPTTVSRIIESTPMGETEREKECQRKAGTLFETPIFDELSTGMLSQPTSIMAQLQFRNSMAIPELLEQITDSFVKASNPNPNPLRAIVRIT
jgi:hypothetical protein